MTLLSHYLEVRGLYLAHAYARLPLSRFTREVLELEPKARAKIRKLEQSLLAPMDDTS